jgi:hypothetical protein
VRISQQRIETPQQRLRRRRRENLDVFIGILGFFTALIFVSTAVAEIKGEPSLTRALVLAVLVGLVMATWYVRRRV